MKLNPYHHKAVTPVPFNALFKMCHHINKKYDKHKWLACWVSENEWDSDRIGGLVKKLSEPIVVLKLHLLRTYGVKALSMA
jgi:hypothetical protein